MPAVRDGDRIVIVDRKIFRDDNTRIFVGVVEECEDVVVRARGFSFHVSPYEVAGAERRSEERVRVVSLTNGDIFYLLPRSIEVAKLQLKRSPKNLTLTDGGELTMDLTEWILRG
ncbi:MAG: hypothetical protein ACREP6_11875 [Candidatus Binataceae bacterium]